MLIDGLKREDIARAQGMRYEKYDNEWWMLGPKPSGIDTVSFINVRRLSTLDEELEKDAEEIDLARVIKEAVEKFR